VAANVALIVASGSTSVEAPAAASRKLPVVFRPATRSSPATALNIAAARGSSPAISAMSVEIAAKKVALLRDASPEARAARSGSTTAVRAARGSART
jgi:hypothetical protein